jgi:hypothetical protein
MGHMYDYPLIDDVSTYIHASCERVALHMACLREAWKHGISCWLWSQVPKGPGPGGTSTHIAAASAGPASGRAPPTPRRARGAVLAPPPITTPARSPRPRPQVFLTHLHSDHHADLATLYVGAMFGRKQPWEVWGPSAATPELGTAAAIEGLRRVSGRQPAAARRIIFVCVLVRVCVCVCVCVCVVDGIWDGGRWEECGRGAADKKGASSVWDTASPGSHHGAWQNAWSTRCKGDSSFGVIRIVHRCETSSPTRTHARAWAAPSPPHPVTPPYPRLSPRARSPAVHGMGHRRAPPH